VKTNNPRKMSMKVCSRCNQHGFSSLPEYMVPLVVFLTVTFVSIPIYGRAMRHAAKVAAKAGRTVWSSPVFKER
jgi:hypothetical protein